MQIIDSTRLPYKIVPEPYKRSQQMVLDKSDGDVGDFTLLTSTLFPFDGKTNAHTHDVDEVIYITSGYGYALSNGEKTPVAAGSVIYARAQEEHQVVNESHETMKLICMYIPALPTEMVASYPREK
jgi:quercetin dioxygenase-like cupin family protein